MMRHGVDPTRGGLSPPRSDSPARRRAQLMRRVQTMSALDDRPELADWRDSVLRRPLNVKRVAGEAEDLPADHPELGPRAFRAAWARRNRSRPWLARVVHPNSTGRRAWDALTGLFVLVSISQVPLQYVLAWWPYIPLAETLAPLLAFVRVWFVAEIVLNLRTGYVTPEGTLVMDPLRIARRYLCSGWLLLDLLGVLPLEALVERAGIAHALRPPTRVEWWQRPGQALGRVRRFSGRLLRTLRAVCARRGGGRRAASARLVQEAWEWSALAYRCKRGTQDTDLAYCEWHETALEQAVNVYRLCRQLHVYRVLAAAHAHGVSMWTAVHVLARMGALGDRTLKLVYLTKWHKLRRLLHLTSLWRIASTWLALRRAQARVAIATMRRSVSTERLHSLCASLSRNVSRHANLDALAADVEALAVDLGGLGLRVASVPARLSEMMPGSPSPLPSPFDLRAGAAAASRPARALLPAVPSLPAWAAALERGPGAPSPRGVYTRAPRRFPRAANRADEDALLELLSRGAQSPPRSPQRAAANSAARMRGEPAPRAARARTPPARMLVEIAIPPAGEASDAVLVDDDDRARLKRSRADSGGTSSAARASGRPRLPSALFMMRPGYTDALPEAVKEEEEEEEEDVDGTDSEASGPWVMPPPSPIGTITRQPTPTDADAETLSRICAAPFAPRAGL